MKRLLNEVAQYIHNEDIGIYHPEATDGNIFIEVLPANPDKCIGIFARGGLIGDVTGKVTTAIIQFIVRDTDKLEALDIGYTIIKKLCGYNSKPLIMSGYGIVDTNASQGVPIYLDTDQAGRHEYSVNLEIEYYIEEEL